MDFKDVIFKYVKISGYTLITYVGEIPDKYVRNGSRSFWKAIWKGRCIDTGYNKGSLVKRIRAQCD